MQKLSYSNTTTQRAQILSISPSALKYEDGLTSFIIGSEKVKGCCVNCEEKYCMRYTEGEILPNEFKAFPHNTDQRVCPTNAIIINRNDNKPSIASTCINCGLCIHRCPFAAIQFSARQKRCEINHDSPLLIEGDYHTQQEQARKFRALNKTIAYDKISRDFANTYSIALQMGAKRFSDLSEIVVRNSLINLGYKCGLNAQGNNHIRTEFYAANNSNYVIGESDITDADTLSITRRLLDDLAVMVNRYSIKKEQILPLGVINGLPNKRTDFYEVIEDIHKITNIQINILTYHVLFLLNLFDVKFSSNELSRFVINRSHSSLISEVSRYIPNIYLIDENIKYSNYYEPNK